MTLFDAYVFVDWSARNALSRVKPGKDAIWVGELIPPGEPTEIYHRGREQASAHLRDRLHLLVRDGRRVLVGFDFPYGYPAGLASCLAAGSAKPWRAIWELLADELVDDEKNKSNRFAVASRLNERLGGGPGPFWGCHSASYTPALTPTKTGLFVFPFAVADQELQRLRRTEQTIGGPQETWKLAGAGSVGGQALVGIPRVRALRDDPVLAPIGAVWPFETGFTPRPAPATGPWVLHAEIWPGIIASEALASETAATGAIRDQVQVRLMCRWAFDEDRDGSLGTWFDATVLDESGRRIAVDEEGWILGCRA